MVLDKFFTMLRNFLFMLFEYFELPIWLFALVNIIAIPPLILFTIFVLKSMAINAVAADPGPWCILIAMLFHLGFYMVDSQREVQGAIDKTLHPRTAQVIALPTMLLKKISALTAVIKAVSTTVTTKFDEIMTGLVVTAASVIKYGDASTRKFQDMNIRFDEMSAALEDIRQRLPLVHQSSSQVTVANALVQTEPETAALDEMRTDLATKASKLAAREDELTTIRTQLKQTQTNFEKLQLLSDQTKTTLDNTISKHKGNIDEKNAIIIQRDSDLIKAQTTIATHVNTADCKTKQLQTKQQELLDLQKQLDDANSTIAERDQKLDEARMIMANQHAGIQNLNFIAQSLRNQLEEKEMADDFEMFLVESGQDVSPFSADLMVTSSSGTGHEAVNTSVVEVPEPPATHIAVDMASVDVAEDLVDAAKAPTLDMGETPTEVTTALEREAAASVLAPEYADKEAKQLEHSVPKQSVLPPKQKGILDQNPHDKPKSGEPKCKAPAAAESTFYNPIEADPNGRALMTTTINLTGPKIDLVKPLYCKICKQTFQLSVEVTDMGPGQLPLEEPEWERHNFNFHSDCKFCKKEVAAPWDEVAQEYDFTEHYKVCPKKGNAKRPSHASSTPTSRNTPSHNSASKGQGMYNSRHANNSSSSAAAPSTPSQISTSSGAPHSATSRGAMPQFGKSASSTTSQGLGTSRYAANSSTSAAGPSNPSTASSTPRYAPPRGHMLSFGKSATPSAVQGGARSMTPRPPMSFSNNSAAPPASQGGAEQENTGSAWAAPGATVHQY